MFKQFGFPTENGIKQFMIPATDTADKYPTKADCKAGSEIYVIDEVENKVVAIKFFDGEHWNIHRPEYSDISNLLTSQLGKLSSASHTRPNDSTVYAANDVVNSTQAANLAFTNISTKNGSSFLVTGVKMRVDVNAVPTGMSGFRLHLYSSAPTTIADNLPFNIPAADRAKYLGYVTIPTPVKLGDTLWAQDDNVNFNGALAADSTTIYGILETLGAFTPTASCVKTISLSVVGV